MEENNKEIKIENSDLDTIKVIREEYEKKLADLEKKHEEEIKKIREEEHLKSVETIRALMSGKQVEISENPAPEKEISYEEQLIIDTRKNFGL